MLCTADNLSYRNGGGMQIKLKSHALQTYIFLNHRGSFIFMTSFCACILFHHLSLLVSAPDVSKNIFFSTFSPFTPYFKFFALWVDFGNIILIFLWCRFGKSVNETLQARWRMASEYSLMVLITLLHRKLRSSKGNLGVHHQVFLPKLLGTRVFMFVWKWLTTTYRAQPAEANTLEGIC